MAVPAWFDEKAYLNNKLFQMGTGWDEAHLKEAFEAGGYSTDAEGLYRHFQDYGNAENVSPNPLFNVSEYLKAKAEQLNALEDGKGFEGHQWNEASTLAAITAAGLSVWDHYTQYGMYEGVNPSNLFDTSDYLAAKLAQLQADEPDQNWTQASMLEAFQAAGLNPIEHYSLYGKDESLSVSPVSDDEKVVTNFNPYAPSNPGDIFSLTTAADTVAGTGKDDVINGVSSSLSADRTLNPEDAIDGGEGSDTLHVDMQANFSGFTTGSMSNVENVELVNGGGIARTFSAKGVEGVETYTLDAAGAAINLADLASAGITVNLHGQKQGGSSIGFAADAVKGKDDALTLGLDGVGTAAADDNDAEYVEVEAKGIENLAVVATGDNFADLSDAATDSITISGTGNLNIAAVAGTLKSLDASALSGDVTADLGDAEVTALRGGAGNDTFTVSAPAANAVLDGGAGNDTLVLDGFSGALQPTMSGFENVTAAGGTLTISGKNVSDFNSLTLKEGAAVTVVNVDAAAFSVTASGTTAGSATLGDATALTYNTEASAETLEDKGQDAVTTEVTASKATSATVNVGAYTAQTGDLTFAAATDVTVNVASGLDEDGEEQTEFAAELTAAKANTLTVNAQGGLGASTFNVGAASAVNFNADKGSSGAVVIQAAKATDVSITAGDALNITGSVLAGAQDVTLTQAKGALTGGVALTKLHQLTVSGDDKTSTVTLGALGSGTQDYNLTVDAQGLKGGFTAGNIDAGEGSAILNFADVSGKAATGTVAGHNVTIHASLTGQTEVGAVTADGNIVIDALGMLGGGAEAAPTDDALTVGALTAGSDGSVRVSFDGSNDVVLGAITAKKVELDASGYLGEVGSTAGAGPIAALSGAITADTVTILGSEIKLNDFDTAAQITANELSFTGGLGDDEVTLTAKSGASLLVDLRTGSGDDTVNIDGIASTTTIKVKGDLGGDADDTIIVDASANVTSGVTIDLGGLKGYTADLTGTSAADTFILGEGSNTITLDVAGAAAPVIDTIKGFGEDDKLAFAAISADIANKTQEVSAAGVTNLDDALALFATGSLKTWAEDTAAVFDFQGDTYLLINDGTAGYKGADDAVVKLVGVSAAEVAAMTAADILVSA